MDVMVDIETLANTSNAVINQVAAVVFNRNTGDIIDKFKKNVDTQTCIDIGLEMNVDTIEWWLNQSKDAQNSILEKPRFSIQNVLKEFANFIRENHLKMKKLEGVDIDKYQFTPADVRLWCHATFDEPVLDNAFRKARIETPWHYRSARDLRTLVDLAKYKVDKKKNTGIAHDALDDCMFQVNYAVECINILNDK